jgi:uncharacterized protein (DUF1501 family)
MQRRQFLQQAAAWSSLVAMGQSAAQQANDYKALVCVFLTGGNDSFNTVLPTDSASWAAYSAIRNQAPTPINLLPAGTAPVSGATPGSPQWLGGVLPLNPIAPPANRSFALHPSLTQLQQLFNTERRLAIVANVGPLIQPITKEAYLTRTAVVPPKLFSHNDQQNMWQGLDVEGVTTGWGGRLLDSFSDAGQFARISLAGTSVWANGSTTRQYQMSPKGAIAMGGGTTVYGSNAVGLALRRIASNTTTTGNSMSNHVLMADLGEMAQKSVLAESSIGAALATLPATDSSVGPESRLLVKDLDGKTVENPLARQLQAVARLIGVRSRLSVGRQVFFVQLGGFDTHDNQNRRHTELMRRLDHAMAYFDQCLGDLGVRNSVTTFTASDFGRTLTSNGDGTDHGWGSHQFVMGGAVQGGRIFGAMPVLSAKNSANNHFDGNADLLLNGVMLPSTSLDQYGMAFADWFGATNGSQIFVNSKNFGAARLRLFG